MTKTLKRVIALLSVSMFMALFSLSCFAQENSSAKKIYTEDLGDGSYCGCHIVRNKRHGPELKDP